jgi:hypothetical protein
VTDIRAVNMRLALRKQVFPHIEEFFCMGIAIIMGQENPVTG